MIYTQSFPALHAKFLSSRQPCPPWPAIITILYMPTRAGYDSRLIFPISDPRGAILCPLNFENGPAVLLRPVPSFWLPNVALFLLQMPSSLCVQNCISTGFDSFPRADWQLPLHRKMICEWNFETMNYQLRFVDKMLGIELSAFCQTLLPNIAAYR